MLAARHASGRECASTGGKSGRAGLRAPVHGVDEGFVAVHDTIGSGHGDGCACHGSLKAMDAMRAAHGEPAGRPMAS